MLSAVTDQLLRVRELRYPLRMDKRRHLDVLESGSGKQLDEFSLLARRYNSGFVLKTVARADFHDTDALR